MVTTRLRPIATVMARSHGYGLFPWLRQVCMAVAWLLYILHGHHHYGPVAEVSAWLSHYEDMVILPCCVLWCFMILCEKGLNTEISEGPTATSQMKNSSLGELYCRSDDWIPLLIPLVCYCIASTQERQRGARAEVTFKARGHFP